MTAPNYVVGGFCPVAEQMRECVDRHFANPEKHGPEHQVWNYWYVPNSYTYLRTSPEKIIERSLVERFVQQLTEYAVTQLGMEHVTWPFLSLYVDGCGQGIHNDSGNGSFGYVYSLTRWDTRRFSGGETMLFHEQDYWSSGRFVLPGATSSFYDLVPARFNQLLLFDDRVPHSVPAVRGVTDPREGRIVMHGHISPKRISVRGGLQELPADCDSAKRLMGYIETFTQQHRGRLNGTATFEMRITADGSVTSVKNLVDRVLPLAAGVDPRAVVEDIAARLRATPLDACRSDSIVTMPFIFG